MSCSRKTFSPFATGSAVFVVIGAAAAGVYKFKVDGLACPFCSYGVEKQLKAIPGVSGVKVSIKTSTVTVTMKRGTKLTKAQASRSVKDAGFTMRNFR